MSLWFPSRLRRIGGTSGPSKVAAMGLVIWLSLFGFVIAANATSKTDPAFIVGYATAVLETSHSLTGFAITYRAGALLIDFEELPSVPFDTIERSLAKIEGVAEVRLSVGGELASASTASEASEPGTARTEEASTGEVVDESPSVVVPIDPDASYDVFSVDQLFEPLLADPRWPHFSAIHQWYLDDDEIERVGSANFGGSFGFVRSPKSGWGQWEVGLQAGVFSVFDLTSESNDLVNSDFFVGLTGSHHYGDFTAILRAYHQSSHLGDEFLLRNRVNRINLSFEVVDLLVSYDPWQWLRLYGGGGLIVHSETQLDRGILQTGIELESPLAFAHGYLRPIAATDLQFRQESDWRVDASVRAGVQIEHPFLRRTQFQILGEYYTGRSPNGQFYERRIKTLGIGLHLNF